MSRREDERKFGLCKGEPTSTNALDRNGLGALCAGGQRFLRGVETGVEESVDEGGLAQARFT